MLIVVGIIFSLYGFCVLAIIGPGQLFNFFFLFSGVALIALDILRRVRKHKSKDTFPLQGNDSKDRTSAIGHSTSQTTSVIEGFSKESTRLFSFNRLRGICIVIALLSLLFFIIFEFFIISFVHQTPVPDADYVIVLGAKVNGLEPSLEYSVRLQAAAEYLADNPRSIVITTGGKGSDEDCSEGHAGMERLVALGVPRDRIIVEDQSTSTRENLLFTKTLIESGGSFAAQIPVETSTSTNLFESGGSSVAQISSDTSDGATLFAAGGDVSRDNVLIVSSSFHLYRASKYAKAVGYGNTSYLGRTGLLLLVPHYYTREFVAFVFDLLRGNFCGGKNI